MSSQTLKKKVAVNLKKLSRKFCASYGNSWKSLHFQTMSEESVKLNKMAGEVVNFEKINGKRQ